MNLNNYIVNLDVLLLLILKLDVAQDMYQEDKRLAELLAGETEDEAKDDTEPSN